MKRAKVRMGDLEEKVNFREIMAPNLFFLKREMNICSEPFKGINYEQDAQSGV